MIYGKVIWALLIVIVQLWVTLGIGTLILGFKRGSESSDDCSDAYIWQDGEF